MIDNFRGGAELTFINVAFTIMCCLAVLAVLLKKVPLNTGGRAKI